jgi:hypothetical protein
MAAMASPSDTVLKHPDNVTEAWEIGWSMRAPSFEHIAATLRTPSYSESYIHFTLLHYQPNIEALEKRVRALLSNGLAREGYEILKAKFAALNAVGPTWAARIAKEQGEDFQQSQRSAFEYAQALFSAFEKNG